MLLAATVPALAQTPPAAPDKKADPPSSAASPVAKGSPQELSFPNFEAFLRYLQKLSPEQRDALLARAQLPPCYFIRQVNQDLRRPKEQPEFVPLASAGSTPAGRASTNCINDWVNLKAAAPGN